MMIAEVTVKSENILEQRVQQYCRRTMEKWAILAPLYCSSNYYLPLLLEALPFLPRVLDCIVERFLPLEFLILILSVKSNS